MQNFLQTCIEQKFRIALIIHGKGKKETQSILKNKINLWLRDLNIVLAFCSALPKHGGTGAVYILLKQSAEEKKFER